MSRAEEIRRELALLAELRELDDEPEAAADEGLELILLELLGEFRKQQVIQGVDDPTLDAEHYALAGVLDRASVEALEAQGWIDPHGREWNLMQQPVPTGVPRPYSIASRRPKLRPIAEPQLPASLRDQVVVHAPEIDLQALVAAEIARLQAPAADDGDIPAELRVNGYPTPSAPVQQVLDATPKKPKKAKKKAGLSIPSTTLRFADGTPVPPAAPREVPAVEYDPGDGNPPSASETVTPAGWTRGPDGQLIAPPRKAVKAVYPPVRGRGRKPPGLALGGLTTNNEWVRHPASGRMVPPDQVREES